MNDNGLKICEKIYKKIFDNLKSELALKIEMLAKIDLFDKKSFTTPGDEDINQIITENKTLIPVLKPSQYTVIKNTFEDSLNEKDKSFGKCFSQTQIFLKYFEDIRMKK